MAAISPPSSSFSAASLSSPISLPSTPSPPRENAAAAFVPFLWEEKPGVSKSAAADSKLSPPQKSEPLHLFIGDLGSLPLPAPPRLQKPSNEGSGSPAKNRDEQKRSIAESLSKRWQGRKARTEDDPFLVAMQACRSDGSKRHSSRTLLQKLFENEDEEASSSLRRFSSSPRAKSLRFFPEPSATIKSTTLAWGRLLSLDDTSCTSLKHRPQEGVYRGTTQHPLSHLSSPHMHSAHQPLTLLQNLSVSTSHDALVPTPLFPPNKKPVATSKRSHATPKAIQHQKRTSGGHDKLMLAGCLGCRNVESDDNTTKPQCAL